MLSLKLSSISLWKTNVISKLSSICLWKTNPKYAYETNSLLWKIKWGMRTNSANTFKLSYGMKNQKTSWKLELEIGIQQKNQCSFLSSSCITWEPENTSHHRTTNNIHEVGVRIWYRAVSKWLLSNICPTGHNVSISNLVLINQPCPWLCRHFALSREQITRTGFMFRWKGKSLLLAISWTQNSWMRWTCFNVP